ncbi:class III extradiol dioxygenase subunit B-like domain-containing protein [Micromonospora phytophila]|uniref:class III extradiol dioxygenase subunit B-like domain-containing protein n=1 Tax=Micromonospora phytophila TaxID=709888 RepID=UPI00203002D3|nr:class III extradiol dioxygenase subunit B-like domain-containing protein [Micromonospora phytophila]MCM0677273.1 class III extradiol dioxygenase subunit B-like domain-containing protein [Micromonospora phytophila]
MTGSARGRTGVSRYGERVPLVAAAVCPHPPLLVPEVAGAAAGELDDLRAACDRAVARLLAAGAEQILLIGGGPETVRFGAADYGSLRAFGVDRYVRLWKTNCAGGERLPLSLTVGAWLIGRSGRDVPRFAEAVAVEAAPQECAALGAELARRAEARTALLVLGDGSACRGEKSPGYDDPRAEAYDAGVARALATTDVDALLGLDPGLSAELKVAGRAPWQVLAGAARAAGGDWRGELTYDAAPYGVAYLVASWERA